MRSWALCSKTRHSAMLGTTPPRACRMYSDAHAPSAGAAWASGLHVLRPGDLHADAPTYASEHVWQGDARSCCAWAAGQGLAVGTEPADVYVSLNGGRSWSAGAAGFAAAPSRSKWSFPAPPHEPHVLSIEHLAAGAAGSEAASRAGQLVAGVEVGGVLVSSLGSHGSSASSASSASGGGDGAEAWQEHSEGLYVDVHSCRINPFDASHWLAVTGERYSHREWAFAMLQSRCGACVSRHAHRCVHGHTHICACLPKS